jgi:hypothetical protein
MAHWTCISMTGFVTLLRRGAPFIGKAHSDKQTLRGLRGLYHTTGAVGWACLLSRTGVGHVLSSKREVFACNRKALLGKNG